jgi:N-acylneuraminate cytidylyltransferase
MSKTISMNADKNVIALIPARGGSKGVPRKNLRSLAGKPLVAHSIERALESGTVTKTVCSTDDEEIAGVARDCGAEVPFLRPPELASDTATDADYAIHAVSWLEENQEWVADFLVILWPTCPLRSSQHIDEAVDLLSKHPDADSVVSVITPAKSPYKMWRMTDQKFLVPLLTSEVFEQYAGPRQRLPKVLAPNGYVHVVRASTLLRSGSILGMKVLPYEMNARHCIDIDTEEDFEVAEAAIRKSLNQ